MSALFMPVIISYKSYPWIKVALKSFRRFFPESPILIIDNNLDPKMPGYEPQTQVERDWILDWRSYDHYHCFDKTEFLKKSHGFAMDRAVQWCKANGIRWMLHFEPDCLISGIEWANRLTDATEKGVWMAGSHRKSYGPIHPTPSIWDVTQIRSSFVEQSRGQDVTHPLFHELMDMKCLMSQIPDRERDYWTQNWDTAQKPWFDAAVRGKALLVEATQDFHHFWCGSTLNPDPSRAGDPRVAQYL